MYMLFFLFLFTSCYFWDLGGMFFFIMFLAKTLFGHHWMIHQRVCQEVVKPDYLKEEANNTG